MRKMIVFAVFMLVGFLASAQSVKTTYYKNDKVKTTEYTIDGITEKVTYQKNGRLIQIATYKDGKLNGRCQEFDKKEKVISQGTYQNGKKVGQWLEYDASSKKVYEITYVENVKVSSMEWAREKQ